MDSSWANSGTRELTTTVAFITSEAHKLHDGIGGSSQFNQELGKFVPFQPYLQLAQALKFNIPTTLGIRYEGDTQESWDNLVEKISQTQTKYKDSTDGFWHSLWYNIGDAKDAMDPWLAIIPEAYGLAVVKAGLAVVFKEFRTQFYQLAGNSAAKRQKIFDTFKGLRDALTRANPTGRSFRANQKVSDCADQVYKAVVDSIEDIIFVTSKDKTSWRKFIPKFKHKPPPPDLDGILQRVTDSTNEFERVLSIARDQAIEDTQMVGQYTAIKAKYIHCDVEKYGKKVESVGGEVSEIHGSIINVRTNLEQLTYNSTCVKKGVDENRTLLKRASEKNEIFHQSIAARIDGAFDRMGEIAARNNALQENQLSTKNQVLELLLEERK
ncbi:MAG: hypothetical protein Q9187_006933, partial [Circinaria calcarea]